ncbi:MAG: glycosyltransferase family 2 protein [Planctomycetota bacterium]
MDHSNNQPLPQFCSGFDNGRDIDQRFLTALPVFNEVNSVDNVLDAVGRNATNILVIDDGSNDGTSELLKRRSDIRLVTHDGNLGYGAALRTAFDYAISNGFEFIVTIDCDGQHEPQRIRDFVRKSISTGCDIVSGSRYLKSFDSDSPPPEQRRLINYQITRIINERLGYQITDAFCGFKSYRVDALTKLQLTDTGYAMPLELWVQAACNDLSVIEVAVPRIYLDENRSFGEELDNPETRMNYYKDVLNRAFAALPVECDMMRSIRVG